MGASRARLPLPGRTCTYVHTYETSPRHHNWTGALPVVAASDQLRLINPTIACIVFASVVRFSRPGSLIAHGLLFRALSGTCAGASRWMKSSKRQENDNGRFGRAVWLIRIKGWFQTSGWMSLASREKQRPRAVTCHRRFAIRGNAQYGARSSQKGDAIGRSRRKRGFPRGESSITLPDVETWVGSLFIPGFNSTCGERPGVQDFFLSA